MNARVLVVDDSPTIRKVVGAILKTRGYEALLAANAPEGLLTVDSEPVDLILLDFVMPEINGYQFCRELRARPRSKDLPVILMSAKTDKIRGAFVRQTGAIDAISKPFDARALIAVIEGALKKKREGRAPPVPDAAWMPEQEPQTDSLLPPPALEGVDIEGPRQKALASFRSELRRLIVPAFEALPGATTAASTALNRALDHALTPTAFAVLQVLFQKEPTRSPPDEVLAGDLAVISLAEVLQLLELQKQTGSLRIFTRRREVTLFMTEGVIAFAAQRGLREEFFIGRKLMQLGVLTREQLEQNLEEQPAMGQLLGEQLVFRGLASAEQVREALVQQTSELLYEVVRWDKGRFSFTAGATSRASDLADLGLPIGALMMEAFRRVDEWRLIEKSFDFNEVLYCDQGALQRVEQSSELTVEERAVLELIDGERSVRQIVDELGGSSFELCKILYQFVNSHLVRSKKAA